MLVNSVSALNNSYIRSNNNVKNTKVNSGVFTQEQPSFKNANYKAAFSRYYNSGMSQASNEQIFRDLMSRAMKARSAKVEQTARNYFKPDSYNDIMNQFRADYSFYGKMNSDCHHSAKWIIPNFVSIVNFGSQGGFLDFIIGEMTQDTRICFHGLDGDKNKVICLGKYHNGNDSRVYTEDGIGTLITAIMWNH